LVVRPPTGERREQKRGSWTDSIQGTVQAFQRAAAPRGASALRGFDAVVTSDLPIGAGLASSAALEAALLRALCMALAIERRRAVASIGRPKGQEGGRRVPDFRAAAA